MTTTLTPNLMTENVNQSVTFYCDNLGFRFLAGLSAQSQSLEAMQQDYNEAVPLQWAMLGYNEARVMFQSRDSLTRECAQMQALPSSVGGTLYLEVDDLDDQLARLGEEVETVLPDP